MSVFPNEKQQKWIAFVAFGLAFFFLVGSAWAFVDMDWVLGVLFLVLALAMVVTEIFRLRGRARSNTRDSETR
ncbi:hypothetical protein M8J71_10085 [Pseudarthrobacter sp. R1]|uniref:hypothetical protein n=1 Tax=Pseudarthrobacter sp. R1 TaxID=2944934 RepID=UPI00210EB6C6|nr:hypothetical protein [Pseudarthrobacter sp. R1]MCQ6270829.1 hypothetical protein [Pseudarthrobacter sp. R1]